MTENQIQQVQTPSWEQTTSIVLNEKEKKEIEHAFSQAKDFRDIGERITAPIDTILKETARIVDKDPIMNVSWELEKMNKEVQKVYKDILDNDWPFMKLLKNIPWIKHIATIVDEKMDEARFNLKTVEGKIEVIFSWFDQSYQSLNSSIQLQKEFITGIETNLWKIIAYKNFLDEKIEEFKNKIEQTENEEQKKKYTLFLQNVEFFQWNLIVLIGNLEMAKKRLEMRLDAATKLSLAMNSSRPIFKTLLSSALLETSSQKAIDASMKTMEIMSKTIDQMSSELTDKVIQSSKETERVISKPVLNSRVFLENVTKLKNHFDEIDTFREQVAKEALEERRLFEEAKQKLENMRVLGTRWVAELEQNLLEDSSQKNTQ